MRKLILTGVVFLLPGIAHAQSPAQAQRPNIVLILADDLGYSDLSCYGSEIQTPNLDHLATQGVKLCSFYNASRCCPTRASIMTGRYPGQVGIGAMIDDYHANQRAVAHSPAYQDHLSKASPTIAELLKKAGYTTLMAGKWHLGRRPEEWPAARGFGHSFVQVNGAMNYYGGPSDPEKKRELMALDDKQWVPPMDGFYSTDAFADHAISFISDAAKDKTKPFFLYLAFNAPHWPLQAPAADIAKYQGKYDAGWQPIRDARHKRMKELGLVPDSQKMAPMDRGNARPWEDVSPENKANWSGRMEVYAAQITHLDAQIGRVLESLQSLGLDDNTLVVFLSDNGGAAEDPNGGDKSAPLGSRDSFRGYGRPWATVSNTPFRLHKTTPYEGGISSPFIARLPGTLEHKDGYLPGTATILDLAPTFLVLANVPIPDSFEGQSILPLLAGEPLDHKPYFCEHEGNRAACIGNYKIVALNDKPWELYDIVIDRTESHNLAESMPEKLKELTTAYDVWAKRTGIQLWSELSKGIAHGGH